MPDVGVGDRRSCSAPRAAVVMGSTMLARDAANGRLGFLFSRPLPWPAIWGGKWLAALVLVVEQRPSWPRSRGWPPTRSRRIGGHHGDSWIRAMLDGTGCGRSLLVLVVLVVGLANFGATALRSRSPWLALDLVLLLAALWATRRYVAPLWLLRHPRARTSGAPRWRSLPAGARPASSAASAQVAVGRTDLRRAHRALSLAFWAVVGLTLAAAAGYWHWVRSAGPGRRERARARPATPRAAGSTSRARRSRGGWYPYGFLIDTTTAAGSARPEPDEDAGESRGSARCFSADGRFAALPGVGRAGAALVLFDLAASPPRPTHVSLESSPPPDWSTTFALSPSADSVFVAHESGASIFALPSGRRVATTTIPPGWRPAAARYLGAGAARAWLVPWNRGAGTAPPRGPRCASSTSTADGARRPPPSRSDARSTLPAVVESRRPDADGERIVTFDGGAPPAGRCDGRPARHARRDEPRRRRFVPRGRTRRGRGPLPSAGEPGRPGATLASSTATARSSESRRWTCRPLDLGLGARGRSREESSSRPSLPFRPDGHPGGRRGARSGSSRGSAVCARCRPSGSVRPRALAGAVSGSVQFLTDGSGHVVRIDFATGARRGRGPGAPRGERLDGW